MKILVRILSGVLLALVLALAAAVLWLDPSDYRDDIGAKFADATGHDLAIDGDLRLSFFPWIGIEANDVSVDGAAGGGGEPLARLDQLQVRARLRPLLLGGRLEVDSLMVVGLRLALVRDAAGRANWAGTSSTSPAADALAVPPETASPETLPGAGEPPAADPRPRRALDALAIGSVEIRDFRISWEDRRTGARLTFDGPALETGPITGGDAVEVRLSGTLAGPGASLRARLALEAAIAPGDAPAAFTLSPSMLRLEDLTSPLGVSIRGELTADITGDLATRRYRATGLDARLELTGAPLGQSRVPVAVQGDLALDLSAGTLQIDGLSVGSGDLHLVGEARGVSLFADPALDGRLEVAPFDLRAWLSERHLGPLRTPDAETLRRVALDTRWQAGAGRLDLDGLTLTVDQTRVAGQASLLPGDIPAYRFDLQADRVDLDRYLPARAEAQGPGASAAAGGPAAPPAGGGVPGEVGRSGSAPPPAAGPPASDLPLERLRALDLEGRLKAGDLRLAGLNLGDADLSLTAKRGRILVEDEVGRFYQGRVAGHLELLADETPPRLSLVQRAAAVQVGPLLQDLTGEDRLQGSGSIDLELDTSGASPLERKQNLAGRLELNLAEGTIEGFNLERMIRVAEARFKGRPAPAEEPQQTSFTELHASAVIAAGVLSNQDLRATSDYLHITGAGKVDIAGERFDYRFAPRFVDPPQGRGIKEIEDIPIPVHLTGSFAQPSWNVDLGPVLRDLARRRLEGELDAEDGGRLRELEERTGIKGLEQGLRRLFGR